MAFANAGGASPKKNPIHQILNRYSTRETDPKASPFLQRPEIDPRLLLCWLGACVEHVAA